MNFNRLLPLLLAATLSACAAKTAKPTPFLERAADLKAQPQTAPFQRAWFVDLAEIREVQKNYSKIFVPPVDLSFFGNTAEHSVADAISFGVSDKEKQEMAEYIRNKFIEALKARNQAGLEVVEGPGPGTLAIEIALTELRPTQLALNAGQTLAGFFIPGSTIVAGAISAGAGAATGPLAAGLIAIEMRFRDTATGRLIGEVSDRQEDPMTVLINVQDFTQYGHARNTVDRWARISAEFLTTPPGHRVAPPLPVSFALW